MPIDQGGGGFGGGPTSGGGGGNGGGGNGGGNKKNRKRNRNRNNGPTYSAKKNPIGFAYSYLVSHGYSRAGAAGIVGNLRAESGMRTNAVGDGGTSLGIAQWHLGRKTNLINFAKSRGASVYSLKLQLDFLMHELKQYGGLNQSLRNTNNVYDAARDFMVQFERPADTSASAIGGRANLANNVIRQYDPKARVVGGGGGGSYSGGGGGGFGGGGGAGSPGPHDNLSREELAEKYGWALSFLKSEPELWDLFKSADRKDWSSAQFVARLRDTKWFQNHSASWREAAYLEKTDPATFRDDIKKVRSDIADMAAQMGAQLSKRELKDISDKVYRFGYSQAQIQNILAQEIQRKNGSFLGEAGAVQDSLIQYANAMGVKVGGQYIKRAVTNMARGAWTEQNIQDRIRRMAENAYPGFAQELKEGQTITDIAEPYLQSMSAILELNPAELDVFDPKIRKALTARGEDGKHQPAGLWDFEQQLRKDPRWLYTKNANDTVSSVTRGVLQDLGFGW